MPDMEQKIILLGDPQQIDRPFLDERTNGLSYAAKYMMNSPLCWQITLSAEECERSALAMDAIKGFEACVKGAKYLKYKEIANNKEINAYLQKGNANLGQLGFTDHSQAHCVQVGGVRQEKSWKRLGYSEHEIELAKIAGYMHDIGNAINRTHHAEYGALLANDLLKETDMSLEDRITVIAAIGNHDESTGSPEDVVSAALIIADKTDVRRSRVLERAFRLRYP